jgi:hypothetical protein
MSHLTIVKRSQLLAAATAITATGFLTVAPPAQAHPMLPLAPGACSQYLFNGNFSLKQSNGDTVRFNSTGPSASGLAEAVTPNGALRGPVSGGIQGDKLDFTVAWDNALPRAIGHYTGTVGNDGFAHGDTQDQLSPASALWDSTVPLVCSTPAAPPAAPAAQPAPAQQPAPPDAQPAAARLGVSVNGPTTLAAGQSGTYTVNVSNPGDVSAPVELFISFNGQLQQAGFTPSGGFNCDVRNYAGGSSSVHCTVGQFQSKATANIVVQGRGSAPGSGQLVANINSSDPGAQFVQKSQQLNVTIT